MRKYAFLWVRSKDKWTSMFVDHCVIMDCRNRMCYHLTRDYDCGYVCESYDSLMERNELIRYMRFESDKDIEHYYNEQKWLHPEGFAAIGNNCETFANGFIGYKASKQTETLALIAIITIGVMI